MWANHAEFIPLVQEVWDRSLYGVEQYQLCKRLKLLKQPLKRLNNLSYSHISKRAEAATVELEN